MDLADKSRTAATYVEALVLSAVIQTLNIDMLHYGQSVLANCSLVIGYFKNQTAIRREQGMW
jgi:hypothetical protein